MNKIGKTFAVVLCAAWCKAAMGQAAPDTILKIDVENAVVYVYDTLDPSAYATVPNSAGPGQGTTRPTFTTSVSEGDIVAVNGKPAKGAFLGRQTAINLTTAPLPGAQTHVGATFFIVISVTSRLL